MAKKIKDQFGRDTGTWYPGIIYELGYYDGSNWVPFYVGESYKKEQRLSQHKSLVKNNDNSLHVYDYIRNDIESKSIEWTMEIVAEYGDEGPTDQEDEQIMRRLVEGYELRNKKKGNANWREKAEEEWNEKLRVAEDMRSRGFTSYKKYREQLDYEQREKRIAEANEARRQQAEQEQLEKEREQVYLDGMSALERELEQARLDARARSVALEKERIDKREKIIQEARIQSEKYKLDKEQKDRILRIKQKQQEEKTRADRQAREERIRIETETLMREEQEQRANLQAIRELKDPDNLKRNLELAQIQENARLLALYIQTIEETKPGSSVLPGAYKQLEIWCKMKEELK